MVQEFLKSTITQMSASDSIVTSIIGIIIVFIVLIAISALIWVVSKVLKASSIKEISPNEETIMESTLSESTRPTLQLVECDEKTAAIIMAIVSDQTKIPLDYLAFKSIKLINNEI